MPNRLNHSTVRDLREISLYYKNLLFWMFDAGGQRYEFRNQVPALPFLALHLILALSCLSSLSIISLLPLLLKTVIYSGIYIALPKPIPTLPCLALTLILGARVCTNLKLLSLSSLCLSLCLSLSTQVSHLLKQLHCSTIQSS